MNVYKNEWLVNNTKLNEYADCDYNLVCKLSEGVEVYTSRQKIKVNGEYKYVEQNEPTYYLFVDPSKGWKLEQYAQSIGKVGIYNVYQINEMCDSIELITTQDTHFKDNINTQNEVKEIKFMMSFGNDKPFGFKKHPRY